MQCIKSNNTYKVYEADGYFMSQDYAEGKEGAAEPVKYVVVNVITNETVLCTNDRAAALSFGEVAKSNIQLSETQLATLVSILEDHMDYVEFQKPENDDTKHSLDYLSELMKQLGTE